MTSNNFVPILINNNEYSMPKGITIIQACELAHVDVPRFCYHERLSIAGNCRMCLVEIEQSPKLIASCAMNITHGMKIHTNTVTVRKAREGILELLLANHPLDCPICDQGGECDLQDQAMVYGSDRGRYQEYKRAVEDKDCGPLIKTVMTRCIHCTRCIRFATEIAGVPVLGTTGRGNSMEVGTYINKLFISEISGNIIDLCPVGALTSKPYAFTARPWELKSVETIDVLDPMCSNIRIDTRGSEIMRILPKLNENINEEWITDKTRFAFDGLKKQRLTTPLIKKQVHRSKADSAVSSFYEKRSWENAFVELQHIFNNLNNKDVNISAVIGKHVDLNSLYIFKKNIHLFSNVFHEDIINKKHNEYTFFDLQNEYTFSSSIKAIDDCDMCILVGINIKNELPLLNARIRKKKISTGAFTVFNIGTPVNLTYPIKNVGLTMNDYYDILKGKHIICKQILSAKKPLIIFGSDFAKYSSNSKSTLNILYNIISRNLKQNGSTKWMPCCYLNNSCSILHIKEIGIKLSSIDEYNVQGNSNNKPSILILCETNDSTELRERITSIKKNKGHNLIIVYVGHHGSDLARIADIILPTSTFTEKQAFYLNIEGRLQQTNIVTRSPGDCRENWRVYKMLMLLFTKNCINLQDAYTKQHLHNNMSDEYGISYKNNDDHILVLKNNLPLHLNNELHSNIAFKSNMFEKTGSFAIQNSIISYSKTNYYLTDLITKNSKIMGQCSAAFIDLKKTQWILNY